MIFYRVVEKQEYAHNLCKRALVMLNGKFTGLVLYKRIDDGLYFLLQRKTSLMGRQYDEMVYGSDTLCRADMQQKVLSYVTAQL